MFSDGILEGVETEDSLNAKDLQEDEGFSVEESEWLIAARTWFRLKQRAPAKAATFRIANLGHW